MQVSISPVFGARAPCENGFTLVELMVVVAIIGILATLAIQQMQTFMARARQAEAKTLLGSIYALEMSALANYDAFMAMPLQGRNGSVVNCAANAIGFSITPCNNKVRYGYTVSLTAGGFTATASTGTGVNNKVYAGCAVPDIWTINQDKKLVQTSASQSICN